MPGHLFYHQSFSIWLYHRVFRFCLLSDRILRNFQTRVSGAFCVAFNADKTRE